jgi:hypothetical protein
MTRLIRAAALSSIALLGGCARINAPDNPAAPLGETFSAQATGSGSFFSRLSGNITVSAFTLTHTGSAGAPTVSYAPAGSTGATVTYLFSAQPTFTNADTLSVTWSCDAVTVLGNHYQVQQRSAYHFVGKVGR